MLIIKGSIIELIHTRKGRLTLRAMEDFYTENSEFFPVTAVDVVEGRATDFEDGEKVPCRASFCTNIKIIE